MKTLNTNTRFFHDYKPLGFDHDGQPEYGSDGDFLIRSEEYGVPQNRHRVIIIGIREDINVKPEILTKSDNPVTLEDVIGDLPKSEVE